MVLFEFIAKLFSHHRSGWFVMRLPQGFTAPILSRRETTESYFTYYVGHKKSVLEKPI